jgi:oligoribonuclease NrnB/cAMP/cGMP phosphodiesterase (DHH superfamily)
VLLHWIDHHRTAIERLEAGGFSLPFTTRVVRDDASAAKLVYDHLSHLAESEARRGGRGAPQRFREFAPMAAMADDNDRWLHRIPGSRELGLVVRAMGAGEGYRSFLELDASLADTPSMKQARARVVEELERNRRLSEATRHEQPIGSLRLVCALCDGYAGEVADEWGKSSPQTVFVFFDVRSQALSFRRSPDLDFDLSKLAEACGGGGHPAASGATIPGLAPELGRIVSEQVAEKLKDLATR